MNQINSPESLKYMYLLYFNIILALFEMSY